MSAGLAKLQLLIELKQKLNAGLDKAKTVVEKATGQMQTRLDSLKMHHIKAFKAMEDRIPGLKNAMELLRNPYVLLAASVVAVAVAFAQVSKEIMEFEHEFTNIRNLNLQKPRSELDAYRKTILDTALATGISHQQMATGFYDLQSSLNVYGKDAVRIATLVGNYSVATQADFTDSINATTKAMKAFGIGADGVKPLLESNAKTVQTGIVTFAELAKVQTEYAGAASAAGQSVDTANKIFAAFTSIAKNADVAANMTKTAFQGLADPKVLNQLDKYGVKVYDTSGNMLRLEDIIQATSNKMKLMNDMQFNKFMGDVGGPEGLTALFGKLRTGADDFFKTMDQFNNTKFDLDLALNNAKDDPMQLKILAANRWHTLMATIGVGLLPMLTRAFEGLNNIILNLSDAWNWFSENGNIIKGVLGGISVGLAILHARMLAVSALQTVLAVKTGIVTAAQWLWNVALSANPIGLIIVAIGALIGGLVAAYNKFDKFRAIIQGTWEVVKGFGTILKEYVIDRIKGLLSGIGSIANAVKLLFNRDFSGAWDATKQGIADISGANAAKAALEKTKNLKGAFLNQYTISMEQSKADKNADPTVDPTVDTETPKPDDPNPLGAMAQSIGGGGSTKNTTINIDSFIKNFSPTHQSFNNMSKDELERWMTEMFLRVVRSAELG